MAFSRLAQSVLEEHYAHHPSDATHLGIHRFDDQLDDFSGAAATSESEAIKKLRAALAAIDPATLTANNALDREQLILALDAGVLDLDTIRMREKDPDVYSSGITGAAYVIMERNYAPAASRLKSLIAREQRMPTALQEARKNLTQAVPIYTKIAIEQIDGNIGFFKNDVPQAFAEITDAVLLNQFAQTNAAVIVSLGEYKTFLERDVLHNAKGTFAFGEETFRKYLAANEMVDLPIDRLLEIAEADRQKNEAAFQATARQMDPTKDADEVLASLQLDHPPAAQLLDATQQTLNSIRQFVVDHHIVTIPPSDPAEVIETPPFMRSTIAAAMDTPGPFETAKLPGFYNMTLPDPRMSSAEQADFMRQWYYASISNTSVHEVYPGHFIQFLYAREFPSDVRKVFSADTNSEGWAHYSEQMMLDEGLHAGEPVYRLAQLQDALLRDVRLIVSIKIHTRGMTIEDATKLFETQGHQVHAAGVVEAKRATSDVLEGDYTLGKLMILKLRDDYHAKMGAAYTLQGFHDAFMRLGQLPLPLTRRAMLGSEGSLF